MAFSSKLGSLLRQNGQIPMTSMLNSICCASTASNRLFIGGLSYGTDDEALREAFSGFGDVTDARVIIDRDSGRSRGFGFVTFGDDESASNAMSAMDVGELNGRNIRVSLPTKNLVAVDLLVAAVVSMVIEALEVDLEGILVTRLLHQTSNETTFLGKQIVKSLG